MDDGGSDFDSDLGDDAQATPHSGAVVGTDHAFVFKPESPEEGIYGMAVASAIIDVRRILMTERFSMEQLRHIARLCLVMCIVFFTLGFQLYVTVMTKFIVTPSAVKSMREAYGDYETHMYDGHTNMTRHGNMRGISIDYFNASRFQTLPQEQQESICSLPLSQPVFLFAILLLWTLTCLRYIRKTAMFTFRLIAIPNAEARTVMEKTDDGNHKVIKLNPYVKAFLVVFIQVPVLLMNLFLMWLGSRWLVATIGFDELLLNAIALEFVLNVHELIYTTVVPLTMKDALGRTVIENHFGSREQPNCCNMLGTFCFLFFAVIWCIIYIRFFQQVLPDYRWDVADVCHVNVHGLMSFF